MILSFNMISDAISADPKFGEGTTFHRESGIALAFGMDKVMRSFLRPQSPYLIDDYRCGVVLKGSLHGRINLIEYHVTAGTLVYITPGSFVEPLDISEDFYIDGIGLTRDAFHLVSSLGVPEIFKGIVKDGRRALTEEEIVQTRSLFRILWGMFHTSGCSKNTKYSMAAALLNHVNDLFSEQESGLVVKKNSARTLFDNFIYLVNTYASKEHQLAFYADKMCITQRYLSSVVHKVSGVSAKQWIDRAIITSAKVMLRHGSLQVAQISYELNFPNPSFFSKYFKRLTGNTPQEYREG